MPISIKLLAGGLAGAALLLSAGAALADPGQATASVNVRSGPGAGYAVLDTLYPGEEVDIQRCTGGWCYVAHNGPNGWVSASYLASDSGGYEPPPPPPTIIYEQPTYVPPPIIVTPGYHHRYRPTRDHRWRDNNPPNWGQPGGPPPRDHRRHDDNPPNWGQPGGPPPAVRPSRPPHSGPPPGTRPQPSSEQERSAEWCKAYPQLCEGRR
jgi:uncharacterized protein YraI